MHVAQGVVVLQATALGAEVLHDEVIEHPVPAARGVLLEMQLGAFEMHLRQHDAPVQQWQQALDPASALELVSAPNLPRRLVEGNLAVAAALRQFEFDRSLPAMITALEQGSDEAGRAALIRVFNEESVTSLVITPPVDAPPAGE